MRAGEPTKEEAMPGRRRVCCVLRVGASVACVGARVSPESERRAACCVLRAAWPAVPCHAACCAFVVSCRVTRVIFESCRRDVQCSAQLVGESAWGQ